MHSNTGPGRDTNINVSFPANLAPVASACLTERRIPGGSPLIELAATDGGGFPRNGLVQKLLPFYRLGYLSLKEIVEKCSVNPAETFGLHQKGNLGIGADADITVLVMKRLDAAMQLCHGRKRIMDHGRVTGSGGTFLTTKAGVKTAQEMQLNYQIADTQRSAYTESGRQNKYSVTVKERNVLKNISVLTLGGTIAYTWKNGVPQIGDLTGFIDSLDEVKKEAVLR